MTQKEYENRIKEIFDLQKQYGVEIHIDDLIDKDHLDCLWYSGTVGVIKYKGYKVLIEANGEIRANGIIDDEEVDFVDKNTGRFYREFGSKLNDKKLASLINSYDENNYLTLDNNNWFEFNIITPGNAFVDMSEYCDNVLDDDILGCFDDIEYYIDSIKIVERDWYNED